MKSFFASIMLLAVVTLNVNVAAQQTLQLKTQSDSLSYAFGIISGTYFNNPNMKDIKKDINLNILQQAETASFNSSKDTLLSTQQAQQFLQSYFMKYQAAVNEKTKKAGEAFLAKNRQKPNVKVTPSGLQYVVVKEGAGAQPVDTSFVTVHYKGSFIDGTVFDSSDRAKDGEVVFRTDNIIPGLKEGLKLMTVGSTYTFYIPSELAYGERGGGSIKPNSTLIFDIELLKVEDHYPVPPAQPAQ